MLPQSFADKGADAPFFRHFARYAGATVALFASLIVVCWYARWRPILQMLPNSAPMQYNTALCFILSGAGLFFLTTSRAKIAPWLGATVAFFTLLTVLQYVTGRDFSIDLLFFNPYFEVNRLNSGRMSPLAAVCFIFIGTGIVLAGAKKQWLHRLAGAGLLACIVAVTAGVALFGYLFGIEAAYGWGVYARMAVYTAATFLLLSSGLLRWSWQTARRQNFNFLRWLPVTGAVTLMAMIAFVSAVSLVQLKNALFWRWHTYQVLLTAGSIVGSLTDAERGMRGYVLSTSPAALELYGSATNSAPRQLAQLAEMIRDNPIQQQRIAVLADDLDAVLAYSRQLMGVRDGQGLPAAVQLEKTGRGLAVIKQVRADLDKFTQEEQRLLIQRDAATASNYNNTARLLVFGSVLAAGLLVLANFGASREFKRRRQSEEILRESEERFRLIVEVVKDYAILMLDVEGHVISWNAGAEHIKGYTAHEILGRHFSIFYTAEALASGKPERTLAEALASGQIEDEGWRIRKDGSRFFADVIITVIRDESGRHRGFVKVTRNITERQQRESERGDLISELQTALAEIKTLSGMIPICAWCKKLRNDTGYWSTVEQYVSTHTRAILTHGMCPDCAAKLGVETGPTPLY